MADTIDTNPAMIVDRDRGFKVWNISEIFVPGGAGGRFVPNPNDIIVEFGAGAIYTFSRVTDVDYTTGKSSTIVIHEMPEAVTPGEEDIILSAAPGRASDAFRAYVNPALEPATITLDRQLYFLGAIASYIKIFVGTDTGVNGEIISAMYDQSGALLGENIPLEKVATAKLPNADVPSGYTTNVKIAAVGYLTRMINDNQLLTVVAYDDAGGPVTSFPLVAQVTSFVRSVDAYKKYIVKDGIAIDSPWISQGDSRLLQFPLNMPLDSLVAWGVVTYSDGSTKRLPIDGKKFKIHGLYANRYIATSAGQEVSLVLTYVLDKDELYYGQSVGEFNHISVPYRAVTTLADNAYSCKLFAYPQWLDSARGYRMRYFLNTLSRNKLYDVTNIARLRIDSPAFEPKLYGTTQNLILSVNLNKMDGQFNDYDFVQPIAVSLREEGNNQDSDLWSVNMNPGNDVVFGIGIKVNGRYVNAGRYDLTFDQGAGSKADWLNKMYFAVDPLRNPASELTPPEPTHFNMVVGSLSQEYSIDYWNRTVSFQAQVSNGDLVFFEWIHRDGNGDIFLGKTGAAYLQSTTSNN